MKKTAHGTILKTFVFIIGLALPVVPLSAIELEEFLSLVESNHPFFSKESLAVEVEEARRDTMLPRYQWSYSLTPQYTIAEPPSSADLFSNLMQTASLEAGMQRGFADGRQVGLSVSTSYTWLQNPPVPTVAETTNSFQHGLTVSFSWPLKKNLERLERLGYDLQEYTIRARQAQLQENEESFLVDPATMFIDWAYALELVDIYRQRLQLAEEQLQTTNRMFRSNLVDRLDVLRSEDAIRTAQQAIFEYQSQAKSIQATLATLTDSEQLYEERPEFDFYTFTELPAAGEAAKSARRSTRLKEPLLVLIEQLRFQRGSFGEREKPTLDLFLEAGIFGPQDELSDSLRVIFPQATVGLSYSPPTGLEQVQSEREFVDTQIRQLQAEIANLEKNVETNVSSLLIQASELQKVIDLNRQLIDSAEEKAREEARLYNQGRNMLTNVIQSRDSVQAQRAKLVDSFARYHRLVIQYRALADQLLPWQ